MQHSHKATVHSLFVSSLGECGQCIWITGRINGPIPSPADSPLFGTSCSFMLERAKHWLSEPPPPATTYPTIPSSCSSVFPVPSGGFWFFCRGSLQMNHPGGTKLDLPPDAWVHPSISSLETLWRNLIPATCIHDFGLSVTTQSLRWSVKVRTWKGWKIWAQGGLQNNSPMCCQSWQRAHFPITCFI